MLRVANASGVTWDVVPTLLLQPNWSPACHASFPPAFKVCNIRVL